ncbi:MAG: ASKHA domain-containing protein [Peptococcaceae bacterium]|nr:ASKHA domain-containing protein [Peptococcaceae bacterium]
MISVTFLPANKKVLVEAGKTILQAAIVAGVKVESACGGKGTCGKCKALLFEPSDMTATKIETKFLTPSELSAGWVLACQRPLFKDTIVTLHEQVDVHQRKTEFHTLKKNFLLAPSVHKVFVILQPPSITDQLPDWERLVAALDLPNVRFNHAVAVNLPKILRQAEYRITVTLDGEDVLAVEAGDTRLRCFGLAIDIGTTTVVAYLIDLGSGLQIGHAAVTNPQNLFGADVISRINFAAIEPDGRRQLQEKVIAGLNGIIDKLCVSANVHSHEIYQATVVGNTTMSHLFLGLDPTYLAPAPFIPVVRASVTLDASTLGLNMLSTGKVTVLPNIAGYVGSDTVGVALAADMLSRPGILLAIDIGTNGEMILAGQNKLLTCSTAAGPAFEGAEIKCGMRAAEGAIEGVSLETDVQLTVIGNVLPRGICGSGLIDAVAALLKAHVIDSSGRLVYKPEQLANLPEQIRSRLRQKEHGREFVLAWGRSTVSGEDIVLTQKDIRELQLAKGAILAGVKILLHEMNISSDEIDQVLLAGAFGNYINKASALDIGLLPQVSPERIQAIGNAAGDGAILALLSVQEREQALNIAQQATHIELSNSQNFQEEFVNALVFPNNK